MGLGVNLRAVPPAIFLRHFLEDESQNPYTVEPRFNKVAGDRPNLFVK